MPPVRLLDNVQLPANEYVIKIKEVDGGRGTLFPGQFMVMDPMGGKVSIPGTETTEPTFGLTATWVEARLREEAAIRGYTVVDPATVLATHLSETLKNNMAEILSYADVKKLLAELPASSPSSSTTSCRARSPSPASSACCRRFSPSASRSATSVPSWRGSQRRSAIPARRRC